MLNENEQIESWDIVFTTTEGRTIRSTQTDIDLPIEITERVDNLLEEFYSCTWKEEE